MEDLNRLKQLSGIRAKDKNIQQLNELNEAPKRQAAPAVPPKSIADMEYDQSPLGALRQYDAAKAAGTLPPVTRAPSAPSPSPSGGSAPVKIVPTKGGDYPVYSKASPEAGSFRDAFAAARAEQGAGGTFTWQGRSYSTNRADDKPATPAVRPITSPGTSSVPKAGAGMPAQPSAIGPSTGPTSRFGDPTSAPYGQLPTQPMNRTGVAPAPSTPAPNVSNLPTTSTTADAGEKAPSSGGAKIPDMISRGREPPAPAPAPAAPPPASGGGEFKDTVGRFPPGTPLPRALGVPPASAGMPAQGYARPAVAPGDMTFKSDLLSKQAKGDFSEEELEETFRTAYEAAMSEGDPGAVWPPEGGIPPAKRVDKNKDYSVYGAAADAARRIDQEKALQQDYSDHDWQMIQHRIDMDNAKQQQAQPGWKPAPASPQVTNPLYNPEKAAAAQAALVKSREDKLAKNGVVRNPDYDLWATANQPKTGNLKRDPYNIDMPEKYIRIEQLPDGHPLKPTNDTTSVGSSEPIVVNPAKGGYKEPAPVEPAPRFNPGLMSTFGGNIKESPNDDLARITKLAGLGEIDMANEAAMAEVDNSPIKYDPNKRDTSPISTGTGSGDNRPIPYNPSAGGSTPPGTVPYRAPPPPPATAMTGEKSTNPFSKPGAGSQSANEQAADLTSVFGGGIKPLSRDEIIRQSGQYPGSPSGVTSVPPGAYTNDKGQSFQDRVNAAADNTPIDLKNPNDNRPYTLAPPPDSIKSNDPKIPAPSAAPVSGSTGPAVGRDEDGNPIVPYRPVPKGTVISGEVDSGPLSKPKPLGPPPSPKATADGNWPDPTPTYPGNGAAEDNGAGWWNARPEAEKQRQEYLKHLEDVKSYAGGGLTPVDRNNARLMGMTDNEMLRHKIEHNKANHNTAQRGGVQTPPTMTYDQLHQFRAKHGFRDLTQDEIDAFRKQHGYPVKEEDMKTALKDKQRSDEALERLKMAAGIW